MDDEKLIILVQENDILYNKANKNYRIPSQKRAVWLKIAQEMGVPEEQCIKRWASLRDRYSKEKKAEKLAYTSGSGTSFVHRWQFVSQLEFLAPYIAPRPVRSTINIVEQNCTPTNTSRLPLSESFDQSLIEMDTDSLVEAVDFPTTSLAYTQSAKKIKKRSFDETDQIFAEAVDSFKKLCKSKEEKLQKKENDPVYSFGKMVTATLNTMTARKQQKAMNLMTEVLMKVKLEYD